jgi:hypothetical protein
MSENISKFSITHPTVGCPVLVTGAGHRLNTSRLGGSEYCHGGVRSLKSFISLFKVVIAHM